jgi:hypothetical protein
MTRYYNDAADFFPVTEKTHDNLHEKLPPGNYVIKRSKVGLFFSKYEQEFEIPAKIYGDTEAKADRIIATFFDRSNSTGVLLSGEKGSGKTMLGKLISKKLAEEHDVPTIFVTQPWTGDSFLELIGNLNQPAVVFFDEFEKVYDGEPCEEFGSHDQSAILTLLDGIFTTQKLFILTCNDRFEIDSHMLNRPGRLYYAFDFGGVSEEFIREYCSDNLIGTNVEGVVKVASLFRRFNFDMLKAIVEEMNRFGETAREALGYLNINPEHDLSQYTIKLYPAGLGQAVKSVTPEMAHSPLTKKGEKVTVYTYDCPKAYVAKRRQKVNGESIVTALDDPDDGGTYMEFRFESKHIKHSTAQTFELINEEGDRLVLMKYESSYDWRAL